MTFFKHDLVCFVSLYTSLVRIDAQEQSLEGNKKAVELYAVMGQSRRLVNQFVLHTYQVSHLDRSFPVQLKTSSLLRCTE